MNLKNILVSHINDNINLSNIFALFQYNNMDNQYHITMLLKNIENNNDAYLTIRIIINNTNICNIRDIFVSRLLENHIYLVHKYEECNSSILNPNSTIKKLIAYADSNSTMNNNIKNIILDLLKKYDLKTYEQIKLLDC